MENSRIQHFGGWDNIEGLETGIQKKARHAPVWIKMNFALKREEDSQTVTERNHSESFSFLTGFLGTRGKTCSAIAR